MVFNSINPIPTDVFLPVVADKGQLSSLYFFG